jgi:hypothetical protein
MVRNPTVTHGAQIVGIDAPASDAEGDRTDGGEQNERNPRHFALRDEAKSSAAARPSAICEGAALVREASVNGMRWKIPIEDCERSSTLETPTVGNRTVRPDYFIQEKRGSADPTPYTCHTAATSRFLSLPPPCARSAKPQTH